MKSPKKIESFLSDFLAATLISVLIRIELYSSGNRIISPENQNFYNISITAASLNKRSKRIIFATVMK